MRHVHARYEHLAAALCLLGLCSFGPGCGGTTSRPPGDPGAVGTGGVAASTGTNTSPSKQEDPAAGAAARALRTANTRFAFDLMGRLDKETAENANVFVSPSSVASALALVYNGTGGETRAGVGKTLHADKIALEQFNASSAALRAALAASQDQQVQISIANALWAGEGITLAPDFLERTRRFYDAEAATLNFASPSALETINKWVSEKTNKKIETLFSSDELHNATSVLANAVYFKGKWTEPFDRDATRDGQFTLADGKKKTLPMMSRTGNYRHLRGEGFQALSLPYGKGAYRMIVVLPDPASDLKTLAAGLTADKWEGWMEKLEAAPETRLMVTLPRFKVAYEASLNSPLSDLGMAAAFGPGADFSPMGLSGHWLSLVKHKAVMEVNEEGTEAAAVTGGVTVVSMPPAFTVDRPFLCAIRHDATGTNLFLGAIRNPEPSS